MKSWMSSAEPAGNPLAGTIDWSLVAFWLLYFFAYGEALVYLLR